MNLTYKMRNRLLKLAVALSACWMALSWIVGWTAVQAAEQTKTPAQVSETKQAPPAPVAIPASEIIPRAEQALRTLQETMFQIAADSEAVLNSIQRDIAVFAGKSDRRWQDETEMISKLRSLQRLGDVLREADAVRGLIRDFSQTRHVRHRAIAFTCL